MRMAIISVPPFDPPARKTMASDTPPITPAATAVSTGYTTLIINAPLLIIAFIFIGKAFTVKSGIVIGLSSLGMILMQRVDFSAVKIDEPVLAALSVIAIAKPS